MKLEKIQTYVTVPPTGIGGSFWVLLKITTDDGVEGIGECYGIPFSGDIACRMVEDTFHRFIAGEDPHNVETMFRKVYSAGFTQRPDLSMMGVFSGIEIALWDILGKATGQPVGRLLGGRYRERVKPYASLLMDQPDILAGIESRGFLVAAPLASRLGLGFTMIRKQGKLPGDTVKYEYDLEYGTDTIEIQADAVQKGQRVVVLDDLLATGGTMAASIELLNRVGADVVGTACIIELTFLGGRDRLGGVPFDTLMAYDD